MADIKNRGGNQRQPGGAPDRDSETDLNETGREELSHNPDLNQADNSRGSQDQTQGSQTGSDIDLIPEP
jgi:hypothetical protein